MTHQALITLGVLATLGLGAILGMLMYFSRRVRYKVMHNPDYKDQFDAIGRIHEETVKIEASASSIQENLNRLGGVQK